MLSEQAIAALKAALPDNQVFTDRTSLVSYELDAGLDRGSVPCFAPLDEGTVAEAHSALSTNLGDLIAWTPKGAVADANNSGIGLSNIEHGRIVAVK